MGKFELADKGSLFLDEIGNLTLATQVKLLRFLQEKKIERVGGTKPIELDVRIIAAASLDLEKAIKEGIPKTPSKINPQKIKPTLRSIPKLPSFSLFCSLI